MTKIEEADTDLKDVIDRALRGETVVVTRGGEAVVELVRTEQKAEAAPKRRMTQEELDAMQARAAARPLPRDSVTLIREMRDEGP